MVKRSTPIKAKPAPRQKRPAKPAKPPRFRKRLALLFMALMVLAGTVIWLSRAATSTYTFNATTQKPSGRMFTNDAPANQLIPSDVRYLADSQTRIQAARPPAQTSLFDWAVPIFDVDASAPKATVFCYVTYCDAITRSPVPVPNGVFAQVGGDRHVVIIDNSARKMYSYWLWKDCFLQPNLNNADWCPGSGILTNIDSNGVGGGGNVAKLAGGLLRTYEIEQGFIDHALVFSATSTCQGNFVYPAVNTDGVTTNAATCIPVGSRLQLDPSVNVDALPNITAMEKMMAKAMQKYGAYAVDTGGSFGFKIELDRTGRNVYQKAGAPTTNQFVLRGIPWDKFKIIEPQWKRDGSKAYAWGSAVATVKPPASGSGGQGGGTSGGSSGSGSSAGGSSSTGSGSGSGSSSGSGGTDTGGGSTATASPSPYSFGTGGSTATDQLVLQARLKNSFALVNRTEVIWGKINGAVSYRVRINNGVAKKTDKLIYSFWHLGSFKQDVRVQALDANGKNIGTEQSLMLQPKCAWYGVCKI